MRLLAKHHGLLDQTGEQNKPSVIGVNIHGPTTTYEVLDESDMDNERGADAPSDTGNEPVEPGA